MRELNVDASVRFFLDHHESISLWASLRSEAADAVGSALAARYDSLTRFAEDQGAVIGRVNDAVWERICLFREDWFVDGAGPMVALVWAKAGLFNRDWREDGYWPYVGVRNSTRSGTLNAKVGVPLAALADLKLSTTLPSPAWPVVPDVKSEHGGAVDPEELAGRAETALRAVWTSVAPKIDDYFGPVDLR